MGALHLCIYAITCQYSNKTILCTQPTLGINLSVSLPSSFSVSFCLKVKNRAIDIFFSYPFSTAGSVKMFLTGIIRQPLAWILKLSALRLLECPTACRCELGRRSPFKENKFFCLWLEMRGQSVSVAPPTRGFVGQRHFLMVWATCATKGFLASESFLKKTAIHGLEQGLQTTETGATSFPPQDFTQPPAT